MKGVKSVTPCIIFFFLNLEKSFFLSSLFLKKKLERIGEHFNNLIRLNYGLKSRQSFILAEQLSSVLLNQKY